jgi:multiple sugar transport system substrate-binding protein
VLSTLIASGQAPTIVGPVGFAGSNQFAGQWLDITSLVEETGYDLAQFPENLVNAYRDGDQLLGLPFAIFPGVLYYNADLFDEAGLNYPPTEPGVPYVMPDGTEVPWDYNTVAEIGKILTVDANGNDATMAEFDPTNIVQYGFIHQWDTIRSDFHTFGANYVVDEDGKVQIWDNWRAEAQWLWDSIWTWHITPTDGVIGSELLNSNAFNSGRVAMARSMLWYTCCLATWSELGPGCPAGVRGHDLCPDRHGQLPHPQGLQEPGGSLHRPAVPAGRGRARPADRLRWLSGAARTSGSRDPGQG